MANKKPDDRLITRYGRMNRIAKPVMGPAIDADESSTIEVLTEMAKERHMPNVFAAAGPYRAQILRIEERRRPEAGIDPDTPEHDIFVREDRDKSVYLVRVKARIPELHAGLPIPTGIGDGDGEHQKIIDMYPSFTAASDDISLGDLAVGDPVWVDFVDKLNYKDGVLLGGIKKASGGSSGTTESAKRARDGACAGSYAAGGSKPSGDSLPLKNKPKSLSGAPPARRRSPNVMSGEFVFLEDGVVSKKVISLWKKSAKKHAPAGKSSWAVVGEYRTLIYKPNVTDIAAPKENIWLFPPQETKLTSDTFDNIAKTCFELATEGRNYILIMALPAPPPPATRAAWAQNSANVQEMARRFEEFASDDIDFQGVANVVREFQAPNGEPPATNRPNPARALLGTNALNAAAESIDAAIRGHSHNVELRQRPDGSPYGFDLTTHASFDMREGESITRQGMGTHTQYMRMYLEFDFDDGERGIRRSVPVVEEYIHNVGHIRYAYDQKLHARERPNMQLVLENTMWSFMWIRLPHAPDEPENWMGPYDGPYIEWFKENLESMIRHPGAQVNPPVPYAPEASRQGSRNYGRPLNINIQRVMGSYIGFVPPIPPSPPAPEVSPPPEGEMDFGAAVAIANELVGEPEENNAVGDALVATGAALESAGIGNDSPAAAEGIAIGGNVVGAPGTALDPLNSPVEALNPLASTGPSLLASYIGKERLARGAWIRFVRERLLHVFSSKIIEGDVDTYVSIGTGAYILQACPLDSFAAPHTSPKRINMIKPVGNLDPEFLSAATSLAEKYTKDGYVEFDLNFIVEVSAVRDFRKKLRVEARSLNDYIYDVGGVNRSSHGAWGLSSGPKDRWVTVLEKPEIDGFRYVGYMSERHMDALKAMSPSVIEAEPFLESDMIPPNENREEDQENDTEEESATPSSATPPERPTPQDPPSIPAPSSPSARPKSSFTPKRSARVEQAAAFKENRVKLKDYGILSRESEKDLLINVPNTKGPGRVKLHVLAAARFEALRSAAQSAGFDDVKIASGYRRHRWRDFEHYKKYVTDKYGSLKEGRRWMAYQSPHESGLALDFGNNGMSPKKARIPEMKRARFYKWLKENAHKYGFTPYKREPWHWEVRIPYNAWASGKEFANGGVEAYAVRVLDVGSKDVAIGDTAAPVGTAVASNAPASPPCVDSVGGTGTRTATGARSGGKTIPGGGGAQGKQAPVVPHPQDKFVIVSGSPCNGCHRRVNKLTNLFVLHETGGNPHSTTELQKRRWASHNKAGGKLNKAVHLWQGVEGKFVQESPLEQNLPHANTLNRWSFGVEVASFSVDAASYGGPASKVMKGLHVIGNPDHKLGREADIPNPNSNGYRYRAIQLPQEIQFEKIWQFVLWATTSEVPSAAGTKIDVPMNFPGLGKDGRFYFSAMGFGNPVPTVKEGDAYKWSRKEKPRGIMAHARVHHGDGLPLEYYCIQRAKGMDRQKAFYSVIGALCSMDKRKGVEIMAPDGYAQLGLELYPWQLNHPTRYDLGRRKWAALDKTKYGLSIA